MTDQVHHRAGRLAAADAADQRLTGSRPDDADAWHLTGLREAKRGQHQTAIEHVERAIALRPDYPDAFNNLGNLLTKTGRHDEAEAAYRQAIALRPDHPDPLNNLGNLLHRRRQFGEALAYFERVMAITADYVGASGMAADCRARMTDWSDEEATRQRLVAGVREKKASVLPFVFINFCDDPLAQRQCAELCVAREHPVARTRAASTQPFSHDRIRLAYISPDFGDHPVAYLMADLIERHDRRRFEVFGVAIGPERRGSWHERLKRGFDHFLDLRGTSDQAAAGRLHGLEIDIAVDLAGYTAASQTGIFAARAAPVQVSYLGFPGTMGAPFIDYILADRFVIPEALQA